EDDTPAVEQGTGTPMDQIPTDFRGYDHWRRTGELPASEESQPPATAPESAPATGEPAEPVKTAPESEPDESQETEPAQPSRPNSRQRRIDRLTRENAELQKRIQALEQPISSPRPAEAAPAPAGRPELKDFQTLEAYTEALTEWKLGQHDAQRKADDEKRAAESAARTLQESWSAREAAAAKAHPDYRELMDSTEIPVGPGVLAARQALLEDEHGAEVLYWLARTPGALEKVASLSPARAILEIGRLSASVADSQSPENPKPKVTSAPRPPAPLTHGTAKTSEDIYDEDFARRDYKAWEKRRVAQLKG
ncbi:MAG TPA: hypothetical protein VKD72_00440, partial [Gemmataceae bacterium]|nr:hypothetical protein [Gemmataceae bacterium]